MKSSLVSLSRDRKLLYLAVLSEIITAGEARRCEHCFFVELDPIISSKHQWKFFQYGLHRHGNRLKQCRTVVSRKLRARSATTTTSQCSRLGADQGSHCSSCYALQQGGNKFCISCGEPQLLSGGSVMYWSLEEARHKQFTNAENGVSSCGPCSILSALSMIGEKTMYIFVDMLSLFSRCCAEAFSAERSAAR